jgi:hypothetical protein
MIKLKHCSFVVFVCVVAVSDDGIESVGEDGKGKILDHPLPARLAEPLLQAGAAVNELLHGLQTEFFSKLKTIILFVAKFGSRY